MVLVDDKKRDPPERAMLQRRQQTLKLQTVTNAGSFMHCPIVPAIERFSTPTR